MLMISRKHILAMVLGASACVPASAFAACDTLSIDPACGYISTNPANPNPINPANPSNLNNPSNPNSPLNPSNQPYSGENIANPYSPYNLQHPESPNSALNINNPHNPASLNNPNNPANPSSPFNIANQKHTDASEVERRHRPDVNYKDGFGGLFDYLRGGHPVVVYGRDGIERECRLGVDCPRSVYVEGGFPVPDHVAAEPGNAPAPVPYRGAHRRHRSEG